MTQLENILSHFKDLAYHLQCTLTDEDMTAEYGEAMELLEGIERGKITAETLIAEHRKSYGTFGSDWNLVDIRDKSEELGEELSTEEIISVAELIEHCHDAEIGINWQVIEDTIGYVVSKREE